MYDLCISCGTRDLRFALWYVLRPSYLVHCVLLLREIYLKLELGYC